MFVEFKYTLMSKPVVLGELFDGPAINSGRFGLPKTATTLAYILAAAIIYIYIYIYSDFTISVRNCLLLSTIL